MPEPDEPEGLEAGRSLDGVPGLEVVACEQCGERFVRVVWGKALVCYGCSAAGRRGGRG